LAPQNLQATWGDSFVDLTWNAPSSDGGSPITNYRIYRGTTPGGEIFLIEIGNLLTYNDGTAVNGNTYYYKVSAVNALGEGPLSNEVFGTPGLPTAPTGLTILGGSSFANLTWIAPSVDGGFPITNYVIYRGTSPGALSYFTEIGNVLFYNDTTVTSGTTYYYKVAAKNSFGTGPNSTEKSVIIAAVPSEPLNIQVKTGDGYVNITWDPPADDGGSPITNYRIYKAETSGGQTSYIEIGNVLYYNDTSVTNGVTYYYIITAKNAVFEGEPSLEVQGTPLGVPSEPLNLQATSGDSWINITWDVPSDDGGTEVTNYRIYKGTVSGSENFLTEIGDVTFYNDSAVNNGVTYFYKVAAKNSVGEGVLSTRTSATPLGLPSAPQNLQAASGDSYVYLTWDAPFDIGGSAITNYRIYGDGDFLIEIGNITNYNNTGLTNGQTYTYNVSAKNAVGEGPLSIEVSATPVAPVIPTVPTVPGNFQATAGDGKIVLTWTAPTSDGGSAITGYKVYRGTTAGNLTLLTTLGNVLTYTDSSVTNGQTYYYKVTALNAIGEGAQSTEASTTPEAVTTDEDDGIPVMVIALLAIVVLIVIILLVAMMRKKKPGKEVLEEVDPAQNSE
jgi:fibronectin type 3 domain-containing protein